MKTLLLWHHRRRRGFLYVKVLNSLFQLPTLNELEQVATNENNSLKKLTVDQLESVKKSGEFEVDSNYFPGQKHRWALSALLQTGTEKAHAIFYKELSWSLYLLIIFARDRILSNCFSLKAALRSWKHGLLTLLGRYYEAQNTLIGLPANKSDGLNEQINNERKKFLVIELLPHNDERDIHLAFCAQVPILLQFMDEEKRYTLRKEQVKPPKMLPYPHHFLTPSNIHIDFRLHNRDLQQKIQSIILRLLDNNIPKTWFNTTKRQLLDEYKHQPENSMLSKENLANKINERILQLYLEKVFDIIQNSKEIEKCSSGLGDLIVAHSRSVLVMQDVVKCLNKQLEEHLENTKQTLIKQHPIKSKIRRWLEAKLVEAQILFVKRHEWDAHLQAIERCKTLGNLQAAYFIQRDLIFRKDNERVLRMNLKAISEPVRTIYQRRNIWFPVNWIVERTYPLPVQQIPTTFASKTGETVNDNQGRLLTDADMLIPFVSPVSFTALFSPKPFTPDYVLEQKDLKLHPNRNRKYQTFLSRLMAIWTNVRQSRTKFEALPDRGEYGRRLFCLINVIVNNFILCGICQPVLAVLAVLASPVISFLVLIYSVLHRCTRGLYDKIMFHTVIKRFARIPVQDTFLAMRVAGPGLASQYFYQVAPPEVLAVFEAFIEQEELKTYRSYIEKMLTKPIQEYEEFFNEAFHPFSATVTHPSADNENVYSRMMKNKAKYIDELNDAVQKRMKILSLKKDDDYRRIRLTETNLSLVLIEAGQLVKKWYPQRILPYLQKDIELFWNSYDLEQDDWIGLASKLLKELFFDHILVPLEHTDAHYSLQIDHLSLKKYVDMIIEAKVRDDLDAVTSVYLPQCKDKNVYTRKARHHGLLYRFFNCGPKYLYHNDKYTPVDYTSVSCHFSIPIQLPEVICVSIIIYNRDNSDNTMVSLKNVSLDDIVQLIHYNSQYYKTPVLPRSIVRNMDKNQNNNNDDDPIHQDNLLAPSTDDELSSNIVQLDENLL
ncbi:unnamed protein product [Didymodactylos carnosus]|uniref:Uncharacterized protein n=1 Tax=Didymodactylos carnosus TaxID=1234261 RepID=A0A8S2CRE2_9BILA|nr:unnamed protein product [Didymodactylos carnosus]CAF3501970.1 unnamed protein product [Didymodactylos carnosus]